MHRNAMGQKQQGMTAIGFALIATLVALVGYGGLRLIPVYLTQMKVQKVLADLKIEYEDNGSTAGELQAALGKRLNIDAIDYPKRQDFLIGRIDGGWRLSVSYEDKAPYLGNLSLMASFDNAVEIRQ